MVSINWASSPASLAYSCSIPPKRSRGKPALVKVPSSENGDLSGVYDNKNFKKSIDFSIWAQELS